MSSPFSLSVYLFIFVTLTCGSGEYYSIVVFSNNTIFLCFVYFSPNIKDITCHQGAGRFGRQVSAVASFGCVMHLKEFSFNLA